jgi:hypothetical protein
MAVYPLKFHPGFVHELEMAISYYDEHSANAGKRFRLAVKKQLNLIKKAPQLKTIRYDDVRFARLEGFPYAIHYSIDAPDHQVLVHTLVSDHQNPEVYWQKRL